MEYAASFQDMFDMDAASKVSISLWLPNFTHGLLDLSTSRFDQMLGTINGKIALHLLKSSKEGRMVEAFFQLAPLLQILFEQKSNAKLINALLRYSLNVVPDVTADELRAIVVDNINAVAGDAMMTVVEQIEQKYRPQIEAAQARAELAEVAQAAQAAQAQAAESVEELREQLRAARIEPKH